MSLDDEIKRIRDAEELLRRAADPLGALDDQLATINNLSRLAGMDNTSARILAGAMDSTMANVLSGAMDSTSARILSGALDPRLKLQHDLSAIAGVDTSGMLALTSDFDRHAKLLAGPMEDYRRLGLLDATSPLRRTLDSAFLAHQKFIDQFRLPEVTELQKLAHGAFATSDLARVLGGTFASYENSIASAMRSMNTPWLLRDEVTRSARAFAELQTIGHALGSIAPFDADLATSLRGALGDWRDVTVLPTTIFDNVLARDEYYVDLGFDQSLTDFTAEAFDETSKLAGLATDRADDEPEDDEEYGLLRTNRAHHLLMRFERDIREAINILMTAEFGESWIERQTPGEMADEWKKKKIKAMEKGEPDQPLVAYADFTDYIKIIERADNWSRIFKAVFSRKSDVQESFVRLFPIRICTMHSRIITLEDELLMKVETLRVRKAFGRPS
jgi:hypothetical protein